LTIFADPAATTSDPSTGVLVASFAGAILLYAAVRAGGNMQGRRMVAMMEREAENPSEFVRHYHAAALTNRARFVSMVAFCVGFVALAACIREGVPWWSWLLAVFVPICVIAFAELRVVRAGIYERPDGALLRSPVRHELFRWDEIDRFECQRTRGRERVVVVLSDGRSRRLSGVHQGRRVVWRWGETTDIVSVLNERARTRKADKP
jgi:hypothetical protein